MLSIRLPYCAIRSLQDLRYFRCKTLPALISAVHHNCTGRNILPGRLSMLACNRLRIDPGNGSPVVDYRIEDGFVERRTLEPHEARSTFATEKQWQRLTPEQLSSRVMTDRTVAKWLLRRMGVHRLVRACSQDSSSPNDPVSGSSNRTAA